MIGEPHEVLACKWQGSSRYYRPMLFLRVIIGQGSLRIRGLKKYDDRNMSQRSEQRPPPVLAEMEVHALR